MKTFANYLLHKDWILRIVMRFLSEEKQEQIVLAKFRDELEFFGHDTSHMTDEEIKGSICEVGGVIGAIGFTTEEITDAMRVFARLNKYSMIELIEKFFNVSEKKLIIKLKELDLRLTNAKNRDFKHLESVAIDIMGCDKKTKDPLTLLYITRCSALTVERIIELNDSVNMEDPLVINIAMDMANKGYNNCRIIKKVKS